MTDMTGATTHVFQLKHGTWLYEVHHPELPVGPDGTKASAGNWPFITGVCGSHAEAVEAARLAIDEANTYVPPNGGRSCRMCQRESHRRGYAKRNERRRGTR